MLNKITLPIMVHQNNIVLQNSFRETVVVMIVWYFDLQLSMPLSVSSNPADGEVYSILH
jgi:hypothetical protein